MKYYIQYVEEANDIESRFKRSNLSFKYNLLSHEFTNDTKHPTVVMHLSPSGYDNPKCFKNGKFIPENIKPDSYFDVYVTDFEVLSENLNDEQKKDLLKLMHQNRSYTRKYYVDYRKHHIEKLRNMLAQRLRVAERLRLPLTRARGEKYYNDFVKSIKDEYNRKIEDVQITFTPAERHK